MKTCGKCKAEKPKSEFHKLKKSIDGLCYVCKECSLAANKAWRIANPEKLLAWRRLNPEKIAAQGRAHRAANPEKCAAKTKAWREANSEIMAAHNRAWRLANPERLASHANNRRSRKISAGGSHTGADIRAIFDSQNGLCANCETKLFKSGKHKYHVDHIMPLAKGGTNDKYNLQCLCPGCNVRKHAKDPLEWAKENGRLF